MASWFRSIVSATCTRQPTSRFYSAVVTRSATNKWHLEGVPRPRSILEDDDAVIDLSEDSEVVNGAHPSSAPLHLRRPLGKATPHEFRAHRATIRKAFPEGWAPPRKLSREAMDALRQLHRADPEQFNAAILSDKFKISPEAVRRILKSRWEPSPEKQTKLAMRERTERQAVLKERALKEKLETIDLQEMKKLARSKPRPDSDLKDGQLGVSKSDTFTFQ